MSLVCFDEASTLKRMAVLARYLRELDDGLMKGYLRELKDGLMEGYLRELDDGLVELGECAVPHRYAVVEAEREHQHPPDRGQYDCQDQVNLPPGFELYC